MEDRTVIEWDKDDLDTLRMLKIDVLALGMLTCIRKGFDLIHQHCGGEKLTLANVPPEESEVYDMLCKADSVGVFQVESRAQMSMLPRLKPRNFYDLVVEVAIVRPGPIQGDMVHPYLRRRDGLEEADFPSNELREVLKKTYGVPLFQEQAMRIAIVAAGFTPAQSDQLRRAMATFRRNGTIGTLKDKFIDGMIAKNYTRDFAERCFKQIEGFGDYGFPESHAASFALLVYVSAWMKCRHPAAFACAILNAQPMGFYAPAQLVRDAREHGVEVRPVDVNVSDWDNTLERAHDGSLALRLGFREIAGCRQQDAAQLVSARGAGYCTLHELWRKSGLGPAALETLAKADAFGSLFIDRRRALWQIHALDDGQMPLFDPDEASPAAREWPSHIPVEDLSAPLPAMSLGEQVIEDYHAIGMSLRAHPVGLLRAPLDRLGVTPNKFLAHRQGWPADQGRRHRAGAPASRHRQRRHLHDPRGRPGHRQHRGLAQGVRDLSPHRARRPDGRDRGQAAARRHRRPCGRRPRDGPDAAAAYPQRGEARHQPRHRPRRRGEARHHRRPAPAPPA